MSVTEKQSAPASGMLICQPLTKETQKGKFQVDIQQERGEKRWPYERNADSLLSWGKLIKVHSRREVYSGVKSMFSLPKALSPVTSSTTHTKDKDRQSFTIILRHGADFIHKYLLTAIQTTSTRFHVRLKVWICTYFKTCS